MIEAEEIIDRGIMTGIEDTIHLLDLNPEDIILIEGPIAGKMFIIIEVTADSPEVEAYPDPLPGGPVASRSLRRVND